MSTTAVAAGAGVGNQGAAEAATAVVEDRRWVILSVLCLALVIVGIDGTIVNVALPTLSRDLGASSSQLQWIVDAYTIVFAGFLLLAGNTGDRLGRKGALLAGLVIFGTGSLAGSLVGTTGALIFTRGVQGFGAAFIMPTTLSVLTNVFRDSVERTRAISIWAGVSGLGVAVGPLTGGFLLEHYWWGSIFLVNVPIIVATLGLVLWLVPHSKDPAAPRLDLLGTLLVTVGLVALLYGIIEGPVLGWGTARVAGGFALGVVLLVGFVLWELHTDHPILDVSFFKNPRFSAASIAVTLVFFAMFGCLYFLSQYMQFVLGYTPLQTGWRLMPVAGVLMVGSVLTAPLVRRVGTKLVVASGLALAAIGLLILATATVDSGYPHVLAVLVVAGFGMALAMAPATDSIMGSLPATKAGVGSAMNDTTREIGGALGVAVLGSVMNSGYRSSITANPDFGTLQQASAEAAAAVRDSVGGAAEVATRLPSDLAQQLTHAANAAFVDALDSTVIVGAVVAFAGALVALLFLPARARPVAALEGAGAAEAVATERGGEVATTAAAVGEGVATGEEEGEVVAGRRDLRHLAEASVDLRRPRRRALADATFDLLAEAGYSSLTFNAVASRAGLGDKVPDDIDDHVNRIDAVVAALDTVFEDNPVPDTGSFRRDARTWMLGMGEALSAERAAPVVATLLDAAAHDDDLAAELRRKLVAPQRDAVAGMVERAKARGELPPGADTEVVVDLLVAPLLHRRLVTGQPTTDTVVDATLDLLADGPVAPSGSGPPSGPGA
jgi:EmrB/QacA subfamily drug resistance transporter